MTELSFVSEPLVLLLTPFVLRRLMMSHIMRHIKEMCGISVREQTYDFHLAYDETKFTLNEGLFDLDQYITT